VHHGVINIAKSLDVVTENSPVPNVADGFVTQIPVLRGHDFTGNVIVRNILLKHRNLEFTQYLFNQRIRTNVSLTSIISWYSKLD